jgi:hypothetical protein
VVQALGFQGKAVGSIPMVCCSFAFASTCESKVLGSRLKKIFKIHSGLKKIFIEKFASLGFSTEN